MYCNTSLPKVPSLALLYLVKYSNWYRKQTNEKSILIREWVAGITWRPRVCFRNKWEMRITTTITTISRALWHMRLWSPLLRVTSPQSSAKRRTYGKHLWVAYFFKYYFSILTFAYFMIWPRSQSSDFNHFLHRG